jgi:predicted tellurium resistance membrane protein TerC
MTAPALAWAAFAAFVVAAARLRYLRPGLAVILLAVAAKLLLADVVSFLAWSAPAFIALVLRWWRSLLAGLPRSPGGYSKRVISSGGSVVASTSQ